jgi:hypothetical protein
LKDRKLSRRSKGIIELEMNFVYNPLKAVLKTFNPRDEKMITTESKLKVPVLKQNIMRIHNLAQAVINTGAFIDSCFRWIFPLRSFISFMAYILIILNFELYMLPLALVVIFIKNYILIRIKAANSLNADEEINNDFDFVDEEDETMDSDSKVKKK